MPSKSEEEEDGKGLFALQSIGESKRTPRTDCKANGIRLTVLIDSGAAFNTITEDAARKIYSGERIKVWRPAEAVMIKVGITEAIPIDIEIGDVQTKIIAYIVPKIPSGLDMLIGQDFLDDYSEGYRMMLQEFPPKFGSPGISTTPEEGEEHACPIQVSANFQNNME